MLYPDLLPSQSSSGFSPYPLSPGLAISALVCLDFTFHLLSSVISFLWPHLYLAFAHVQSSRVFPLAHPNMRISLCAMSSSPSFQLSNIHHGWFYSRLVDGVFQLCWYVPVAHHPSSFPSLWPGNLYMERGSSAVECRTRNQVSPGSNPALLLFRRLGVFVLSIDAPVDSAV